MEKAVHDKPFINARRACTPRAQKKNGAGALNPGLDPGDSNSARQHQFSNPKVLDGAKRGA